MAEFSGYWLTMSIVFPIWGGLWYVFDRNYGRRLRTWWYNIRHEYPLPAAEQKGFIYGRVTQKQVFWITVVSTAQSIIVIMASQQVNVLMELVAWVIELPTMLIGVKVLGPFFGFIAEKLPAFYKWSDQMTAKKRRAAQDQEPPREVEAVDVNELPEAEPIPANQPSSKPTELPELEEVKVREEKPKPQPRRRYFSDFNPK